MDCRQNVDLFFLPDEKFDFDVSMSPASSKGDEEEDEVFLVPVSPQESCVPVHVPPAVEPSGPRESWSQLTEDQLEAVCQEAHRLADQLQNSEPSPPHHHQDGETARTADATDHREEFIQDTVSKMDVLGQTAHVLSPIKRQTFCVQDSPMKELPPAIQRRLLSTNAASSKRPAPNKRLSSARVAPAVPPTRTAATRLSTSSPIAVAKPQHRMSLRGRASLGVGVVLPSKPTVPTTSCLASKTKVEKGRLQPPSKVVGRGQRQSLSSRPSCRADSYEDLNSDSASVASDVSDSSLNSSLLGKRTLAPPTKTAARNVSGMRAPPLQNRRVADKKNTSSSSSSVSSFNSSLSVSPAKGRRNSSLNRSVSSTTAPAPSSIKRPANPSRQSLSAAGSRRSLSCQTRRASEAEHGKAVKSTPLKRAEATPLRTPAKRVMEKNVSVPPTATVCPQSGVRAKPKPEAQVVPTLSGAVKGVQHREAVSKMLKPTRLVSGGSVNSVPPTPPAVPLTPSAGSCKSLQMKLRRPSALPTPVKRRTSSIPTPIKSQLARPPPTPDAKPTVSTAKAESSPTPSDLQEEESVDVTDIQPFCLEEEQPLAAPSCSPAQPEQSESMEPDAPSQVQPHSITTLMELEMNKESNSKAPEVLLLDLPAPILHPREKLLIDLTNTPDLVRTNGKPGTTSQLIDLSSPLIKWSPEDKRENNAPLINLSF